MDHGLGPGVSGLEGLEGLVSQNLPLCQLPTVSMSVKIINAFLLAVVFHTTTQAYLLASSGSMQTVLRGMAALLAQARENKQQASETSMSRAGVKHKCATRARAVATPVTPSPRQINGNTWALTGQFVTPQCIPSAAFSRIQPAQPYVLNVQRGVCPEVQLRLSQPEKKNKGGLKVQHGGRSN